MLYLRKFAKPITLDASILFLTCSTLRCDACGDKVSHAKQIIEWMDAVFDEAVVFDGATPCRRRQQRRMP